MPHLFQSCGLLMDLSNRNKLTIWTNIPYFCRCYLCPGSTPEKCSFSSNEIQAQNVRLGNRKCFGIKLLRFYL